MSQSSANTPLSRELDGVASRLALLRSRARTLLIAAGIGRVSALALGVLLVAALVDFVVRTPDWFRLVLWIAGAVALVWLARRHVLPGLRFRPTIPQMALRVERSPEGRAAGLEGVLTSGLELAQELGAQGPEATRVLAERVVAQAGERFRGFRLSSVLNLAAPRRTLLAAAIALASTLVLASISGPALTRTAALRLLAPWSGAQWPKRLPVVDVGPVKVHPTGSALPLRAAVKSAGAGTRVVARYRTIAGGDPGEWRRVLLTSQGRAVELPAGPDSASSPEQGELFERLIEPEWRATGGAGDLELEYWFETADDRTEPHRVRLVEPPAVVSASARVTPPDYATSAIAAGRSLVSGDRDLGTGNDQRAVVGPVLAGSRVELSITFNKPLPGPSSASPELVHEFARAAFPGAEWPEGLTLETQGSTWRLAWTATRSLRAPVRPADEFGLMGRDESAYAIDVTDDKPPAAAIIDPREDESVLATAVVDVVGEGRDDVALASLELLQQRLTPTKGSMAAAAATPPSDPAVREPIASEKATPEPTVLPGLVVVPELNPASPPASGQVSTRLDLSTLSLSPGDELWLFAQAQDALAARAPTRSLPRKLRIIREEQLVEQVRSELTNLRKAAIRMDADQADLKRAVDAGRVSVDDRRRQAALTQRLQQQRDAVSRLERRVDRNQLDDRPLSELLAEVGAALGEAQPSSDRAAQTLDQSAQRQAPPGQAEQDQAELNKDEQQRASAEQDAVRDQLGRVAQMLDKGEDSWLLSRSVQRLLDQQKRLADQTRRAGEGTVGKRSQDLSPQERSQLGQLGEQQQRLSDQARATLDQLAQRAKQMEKADAAQAQSLRQAEQRGRERQVADRMNEAARAVRENQTSSAEANQAEAIAALEQMSQDLQNAQKNRQAALRRVVAELAETLAKLVAEQESQIAALARAIDPDAVEPARFAGLDAAMIELNKSTLAAGDKARGDKTLAALATTIDKAADAQGLAITALRKDPVDGESASIAEAESLRLLKLALAEAQKKQSDSNRQQQEEQRSKLRQLYRDALETQVTLQGETDPFVAKPLERRERVRLRALGERQAAIQEKLAQIRKDAQDLEDSTVFTLAHDRLDQSTGLAAKKLNAAQADASVKRNQDAAVRLLAALVQALDDRAKDNDEFRDDEDAGGGGGQGQQGQKPPLIPPLAELRLLRGMQQEVAERTRAADEAPEAGKDHDAALRDADLRRLAEDQRKLAQRGQEIIDKLKPQNAPENEPKGKDRQ